MGDAGIHAHRRLVSEVAAAMCIEGEVGHADRPARLRAELRAQGDECVEVVAPWVAECGIVVVRLRGAVDRAGDEIREPAQTMTEGDTATGLRVICSTL